MDGRRVPVFFYGLFMDAEILRGKAVDPRAGRPARVENYALRLGQRALLVPEQGSRCYGMVFDLSHSELEKLYVGADLQAYRPEAVLVRFSDEQTAAALCYNLFALADSTAGNPDYAEKLRQTLERLGFPEDYIRSVKSTDTAALHRHRTQTRDRHLSALAPTTR
jgi:hypothetical protein